MAREGFHFLQNFVAGSSKFPFLVLRPHAFNMAKAATDKKADKKAVAASTKDKSSAKKVAPTKTAVAAKPLSSKEILAKAKAKVQVRPYLTTLSTYLMGCGIRSPRRPRRARPRKVVMSLSRQRATLRMTSLLLSPVPTARCVC